MKLLYLAPLLAASMVFAQAKPVTPTAATGPLITELQQAQMDLYDAKIEEAQIYANAMMAPFQQKKQALIQQLLKENPDYTWHEAQGQNDRSGLMPKPKPQAPPTVPTPAATPSPSPAVPKK